MAVILAHGQVQIHTATRTNRGADRTPKGPKPNPENASQPPGLEGPPLRAWRHVHKST